MTWDQVQGSWKQFKGQVKQKWGDLTNDEIDRVEGQQEELAGLVQKKYGKTREEAEREVNDWAERSKRFLTEPGKPGHVPGFLLSNAEPQSAWNSGSMSRTCKVSMNRGPRRCAGGTSSRSEHTRLARDPRLLERRHRTLSRLRRCRPSRPWRLEFAVDQPDTATCGKAGGCAARARFAVRTCPTMSRVFIFQKTSRGIRALTGSYSPVSSSRNPSIVTSSAR